MSRSLIQCPCQGNSRPGTNLHKIWVAFLKFDNDEFEQSRWGVHYTFIDFNRAIRWASGRDLVHCQVFFWDNEQNSYHTISVDGDYDRVFECNRKEFGRRGWEFFGITVEQWEEMAMWDFLRSQIGKPFNRMASMLAYTPIKPDTDHQTWYCAELVCAAFHQINRLTNYRSGGMQVHQLYDLIKESGEFVYEQHTHPIRFRRTEEAIASGNASLLDLKF